MEHLIQKYEREIMNSSNKEELLDELLRGIKILSVKYHNRDSFDFWYSYTREIISLTHSMPLEYITDVSIGESRTSIFDTISYIGVNRTYDDKELEALLDYLVYCGRRKISPKKDINNYDSYNVEGKCGVGSIGVDNIARTFGLNDKVMRIDPGFDKSSNLLNGNGFHYFNIIEHNGRYFLVDVSYKQFFIKWDCSLERLGVPYLFPPDAGVFMMMDEKRRDLANRLLKRGWVELTKETLKLYLDGFGLSYRNGLYYEEKGDLDFSIDYTSEDYKNFLRKFDNQVKHEGKKVLGYQRVPLKNPEMKFK